MKIVDEKGIEISDYDLSKGYLCETKILLKHHEAMSAVKEVGHYEVIREYPNGGKDVEWIVDIPGVEAKEAFDEYEQVLQYIPFSTVELINQDISELKMKLQKTDYVVLKIAEGVATHEEYADVISKRQNWRKEINKLELELSKLN